MFFGGSWPWREGARSLRVPLQGGLEGAARRPSGEGRSNPPWESLRAQQTQRRLSPQGRVGCGAAPGWPWRGWGRQAAEGRDSMLGRQPCSLRCLLRVGTRLRREHAPQPSGRGPPRCCARALRVVASPCRASAFSRRRGSLLGVRPECELTACWGEDTPVRGFRRGPGG